MDVIQTKREIKERRMRKRVVFEGGRNKPT